MQVGQNITELRKAGNISLETMAINLDIAVEEYSKIEKNEVDLSLNQLEKIAIQLSCSVVDIIELHNANKGIRNYFTNNSGNQGTIINIQGINQEEIRKGYKELYLNELTRIPLLEKLLRENNIQFDF